MCALVALVLTTMEELAGNRATGRAREKFRARYGQNHRPLTPRDTYVGSELEHRIGYFAQRWKTHRSRPPTSSPWQPTTQASPPPSSSFADQVAVACLALASSL